MQEDYTLSLILLFHVNWIDLHDILYLCHDFLAVSLPALYFFQDFRKDWLSVLMIVTSSRSSINIRHLEKATVSTGKEGLLAEGNAAYNWSR